jgi:hypothetical protein
MRDERELEIPLCLIPGRLVEVGLGKDFGRIY